MKKVGQPEDWHLMPNASPTHTKGKRMKRQVEIEGDPDMLDDYDSSQGVRGKVVQRSTQGSSGVVLSPDVAAVFPDSESIDAPSLS